MHIKLSKKETEFERAVRNIWEGLEGENKMENFN